MKKILSALLLFTALFYFNSQSNLFASTRAEGTVESIVEYLNEKSIPLIDETSLDQIITGSVNKRLVLLGESTHGTSEYYLWRAKISRRLIEEQDFDFIVVEGDWPSFYQINRYVKGYEHQDKSSRELLRDHFNRWPQWMWANEEMVDLIEWLKEFNSNRPEEDRIGIYGMDVYSKEESISEVRNYLRNQGNEDYQEIASLYDCFTPYGYDGGNYARAIFSGIENCSQQVTDVVDFLLNNRDDLTAECRESFFNAKQNAYIVKNAEKHYRSAIGRGPESWNYRVFHMEDTVYRLLDHYGEGSKGIVWAHNTHIGDARATPMHRQGSYNISQLAREKLGREAVYIVGFGCYRGRVLAGSSWESARQTMTIPEARDDSWEDLLREVTHNVFVIFFDDDDRSHPVLNRHIDHRAIGVVYNPRQEAGNYVPTVLPERYDAFIFIEETNPLNPLN
ncbi:MAG: erythromycin esterase family protein [Candidatus Cloacimonetes bacterium]|nr:erythromycin esterase family protein [Candidatus Cloacimonadota bacterium]